MQQIRNIVVTGSNKGIGFAMANYLASQSSWNVIMAVRNMQLGKEAVSSILAKYPNAHVQVEQLDISNSKSIDEFVQVVKQKYKTIDVLVNNAGVAAKGDAFDSEVIKFTFDTNFYGTIELTQKLLPLISNNGKIVTIGSTVAKMCFNKFTNEQLKDRWRNPNITREELFGLVKEFADEVADNTFLEKGWPKWSYAVSKLAINTYTSILGHCKQVHDRHIQVYACCPGYVKTDMSSHKGLLTVEEGILTPIYLIQLPFEVCKEWQGGFFFQKKLNSTFL